MFLDERRNRWEGEVIHFAAEFCRWAVDEDVFVDLDVAAICVCGGQPFEAAKVMLEEPHVPIRIYA